MTAVPKPVHQRLAYQIKHGVNLVAVHAQQIVNLQSNMSALQPGAWTTITLAGGWSNLSGYIPAQARILQNGMTQVIGHITGGTPSGVIGTLPAGYFNPVHQHSFSARAMTGAGAVAVPVTGSAFGSLSASVNYDSPLVTLDTAGNLTLSSVSSAVASLSFSELIPLVTA